MKLKLNRPIVVLDLETTGISIYEDRIIEISLLKVHPDGLEESKTRRINPEQEIPASSIAIHGITNDDVADCPTFRQIAPDLYDWIKDCDIIGFNSNRFDVPMLETELRRVGINPDFSGVRFVDVQTIYHKFEQRTLSAAYKFYCSKNLVDAHSAEADVRATYEILQAQLDKYNELQNDIASLAEFSSYGDTGKRVDIAGKLIYAEDGKTILINFGKYKGKILKDVLVAEPGYYEWVQRSDFATDTKLWFTRVKNER